MSCNHEWVFNQDYDETARTESYNCRKCGAHQRINCEAENIQEYGGKVVYICCCGFESFNVEESVDHNRKCNIANSRRLELDEVEDQENLFWDDGAY